MARIATVEVYTQSEGWVEIDVYEPSDLTFSPVEIETPNGWGVPFVTDPGSADTPLEVYTEGRGWQGISRVAYVIIDNFENSELDAAWNASQATGINATSARAAYQGNYGALFTTDTYEFLAADPTYTHNLPYYPQAGDLFDAHFRSRSGAFEPLTDSIWALVFGMNDPPAEDDDNWGSGAIDDTYIWRLLAADDGSGSRLVIQRQTNGSLAVEEHEFFEQSSLVDDQWYRAEVDWHYSVDGDITGRLYKVNDDGSEEPVLNTNGDPLAPTITDTTYSSGGVAIKGVDEFHYDWLKKTAPL